VGVDVNAGLWGTVFDGTGVSVDAGVEVGSASPVAVWTSGGEGVNEDSTENTAVKVRSGVGSEKGGGVTRAGKLHADKLSMMIMAIVTRFFLFRNIGIPPFVSDRT
jgi:hypothetical protein